MPITLLLRCPFCPADRTVEVESTPSPEQVERITELHLRAHAADMTRVVFCRSCDTAEPGHRACYHPDCYCPCSPRDVKETHRGA